MFSEEIRANQETTWRGPGLKSIPQGQLHPHGLVRLGVATRRGLPPWALPRAPEHLEPLTQAPWAHVSKAWPAKDMCAPWRPHRGASVHSASVGQSDEPMTLSATAGERLAGTSPLSHNLQQGQPKRLWPGKWGDDQDRAVCIHHATAPTPGGRGKPSVPASSAQQEGRGHAEAQTMWKPPRQVAFGKIRQAATYVKTLNKHGQNARRGRRPEVHNQVQEFTNWFNKSLRAPTACWEERTLAPQEKGPQSCSQEMNRNKW